MSSSNPFDDFNRTVDRFMRRMNKDLASIATRAEKLFDQAAHTLAGTSAPRNRVAKIAVTDDRGREVGTVTRIKNGWQWSGTRLNDPSGYPGPVTDSTKKLPDAIRALMRHLHGL